MGKLHWRDSIGEGIRAASSGDPTGERNDGPDTQVSSL